MNEQQSFWQLYNKAVKKLDAKQLGEAIRIIQKLIDVTKHWQLLDDLQNVNSAYSLLLEYMIKGVDDPERQSLYTKFIRNCYDIVEKAACLERNREQNPPMTRDMSAILKDLEDLGLKNITGSLNDADLQKHSALYSELFQCAENSTQWTSEQQQQAEEVMNSALVSDNDKIVMIAGLMLSSLYSFDCAKIRFLITKYSETENLRLRIQLLVAFVLPLQKFKSRLFAYQNLQDVFSLLGNKTCFAEDMAVLQIYMLECLSTQDVNKKLHDEIIPAMLKGRKFNPFDFGAGKIEDINELNPEWKTLDKTMGELAQLEAQGADVYYTTFSSLKRFDFFNVKANWFYPYDNNHPMVPSQIRTTQENGIMQALLDGDNLCDSDKYSFCMLTSQMNEQQLQLLASQIPGHENLKTIKEQSREAVCRNVLRNLYRFFYLYNDARPSNPFEDNISFIDNPWLSPVMRNPKTISRVGAFAIEKKAYDVAIKYLESYEENTADASAEIFQKLGFCYQKKKMYSNAISAYEKANALDGNSVWTLRHLAQTNLYMGNYKDALGYYRLLEIKDGNDASIAFRCGECLVKLGQYSEAMKDFFKAEYLDPSNMSVARAIAWYSVLTDDVKQARKYYQKVIDAQPQTEDFVCAGHVAWIDGDKNEAISLYLRAAKKMSAEEFSRSFFADANVLKMHGVTSDEAQFIVDFVVLKKD